MCSTLELSLQTGPAPSRGTAPQSWSVGAALEDVASGVPLGPGPARGLTRAQRTSLKSTNIWVTHKTSGHLVEVLGTWLRALLLSWAGSTRLPSAWESSWAPQCLRSEARQKLRAGGAVDGAPKTKVKKFMMMHRTAGSVLFFDGNPVDVC